MLEPDQKLSRSDMRLLRRAITEGWDVPLEMRTRAIERLGRVIENENDQYAVQAAKTLMTATKLQLDEAKLDQDEDREITEIVVRRERRPIRSDDAGAAPGPDEGSE